MDLTQDLLDILNDKAPKEEEEEEEFMDQDVNVLSDFTSGYLRRLSS
jgi:hypothetical protein